jgi:lysozyme
LEAYRCPRGVWTIGFGHTGSDVLPGVTIDDARAEHLLSADLRRFEDAVNAYVKVRITQNQFDALVSLAFNIGVANFRASTLLKKLNRGEYGGTASEFGRWIHSGGQMLPGLIRRRAEERDLFQKPP